jgi:cytoskeleton protein RodZ
MNLLELGILLRKERERQGLSIRDIMDATKISRRNLSALEDGDVRALPHPVYLKGYVRNYAVLVGLDPEPLVAVVEAQHDGEGRYLPQAKPVAPAAPAAEAEPEPRPAPAPESKPAPEAKPAPESKPAPAPADKSAVEEPPLLRLSTPEPLVQPAKKQSSGLAIVSLLLLVAVLIGLLYQYQRMQGESRPPAPAEPAAAVNATAAPNATIPDSVNATSAQDNASLAEPAPTPAAPSAVGVSGEPPRTAPDPNAKSVSAASIEVTRQASSASAPPSTTAAPAAQAEKARMPGAQLLTITAKPNEICWAGVFEGGKSTTFILRNGESRQVEFMKRAKLILGNAGGVTVRLNGASYPFEGARGQKLTLEFGAR